jgi:hypothetical protein
LENIVSQIKVGFSTRKNNPLSALLRWITHSKASHTWLLISHEFFGLDMVMEATETGFRVIPFDNFKAEGNEVVVVVETGHDLTEGVRYATRWLGESYDFGGLLGASVVLLGRWLKHKWRNPINDPHAMFCSEAVCRVLQIAHYPGTDTLEPSEVTPQDLMDLLVK